MDCIVHCVAESDRTERLSLFILHRCGTKSNIDTCVLCRHTFLSCNNTSVKIQKRGKVAIRQIHLDKGN